MAAARVRNLKLHQSEGPGSGNAFGDLTEAGATPTAPPSGLLRRAREHTMRQDPDRNHHDDTNERCGHRKAEEADGGDQKRREDYATDAGAVVGRGERGRASAYEPGRDDGIDRSGAHRHPAGAAENGRGEQQPWRVRRRPAEEAQRQRDCTGFGDGGQTEAAIERRQIRHNDRADDKMHRHCCRDERQRPAPRFLYGMEINRRAVESDAPAEDGEDEGGANDAPAIEDAVDRGGDHEIPAAG